MTRRMSENFNVRREFEVNTNASGREALVAIFARAQASDRLVEFSARRKIISITLRAFVAQHGDSLESIERLFDVIVPPAERYARFGLAYDIIRTIDTSIETAEEFARLDRFNQAETP